MIFVSKMRNTKRCMFVKNKLA